MNRRPKWNEWKSLCAAASRFHVLKPWVWMDDESLFGVENPEDGQIGYGCVMGTAGELQALFVCLGSEGLEGHRKIRDGEVAIGEMELLHVQSGLMASFVSKSDLAGSDLAIAEKAGWNPGDHGCYPQFRSYRPGYMPWHLTGREARFLKLCLEQANIVATEFRNNQAFLQDAPEGEYLVRAPERNGRILVWKNEWRRPAPLPKESLTSIPICESFLKKLKQTTGVSHQIWEVDFFYAPYSVQEKKSQRPWFPLMTLWVEHNTDFILNCHLAEENRSPEGILAHTLNLMESQASRPLQVLVRKRAVYDLFNPVLEKLGVRTVLEDKLPAIQKARIHLEKQGAGFSDSLA